MKRQYRVLCLLIFLGGCVSGAMAPSKERVAQLKSAYIVALEAPPLSVPPWLRSQIPIQAAGGSVSAVRGIGVYNTIAIFLEMSEASPRSIEASDSIQAILDKSGAWSPTMVLANEVSRQLTAVGVVATAASDIKLIPGFDNRGATLTMENWMSPIRGWYNDTKPKSDYLGGPSVRSPYILEVGLLNYEIVVDKLVMQVVMKLIDSSDGRVIGRSRAANPWKAPNLEPLDQAFADNGRRYKEIFAKEAQTLVRECLLQLGVVR